MDQNKVTSCIIDMHCHIFPGKIEPQATKSIGCFYGMDMKHSGTAAQLLCHGKQAEIGRFLVCSTATSPLQVQAINDYIAQECAAHPQFIGFGTLHPAFPDIAGEMDRMQALGLRGIKLHPDFQKFYIDDAAAFPIYRLAEQKGFPILFHTGDLRYDYSSPLRLARVLKRFDGLYAIAAHFGGYRRWDVSIMALRGFDRLFLDTSSSLFLLEKERAADMIAQFGENRVFFGTDFPMWNPAVELERFFKLDLTKEQQEKILFRNAERFFHCITGSDRTIAR